MWMLRMLEQALRSPSEAARRHASGVLVDHAGVLCGFWLAAMIMAAPHVVESLDHLKLMMGLMLGGAFWPELRTLWRMQRKRCLPGPHWPIAKVEVPINTAFMIHRFAEFM